MTKKLNIEPVMIANDPTIVRGEDGISDVTTIERGPGEQREALTYLSLGAGKVPPKIVVIPELDPLGYLKLSRRCRRRSRLLGPLRELRLW